jgi:predicted nucleic acid-binding protein
MAEIIPTVLVDSVIMIDHFNGISAATEYLLEMQGQLTISVITRAEVLTGFEGQERQLAPATLRRQDRWKMPDALQAAVAKNHKLKFATRDTDDFPPQRYRFVTVPYTI